MTVRKPSFPSSSPQNVTSALRDLSLDLSPTDSHEELGRIESSRKKTFSSHDAPSRPLVQSNLSSNNPFRRKDGDIALPSSPGDGDEQETPEHNLLAQISSSPATPHPSSSTSSPPVHQSATNNRKSAGTAEHHHQQASIKPLDMEYQIRQVTLGNGSGSRKVPILMQNSNGPCPLLALVNAIVISTPADQLDTPLMFFLSSRTQVTIDRLLDAILDNLLTRHAIGDIPQLPDLEEFHHFLFAIQTGMNANPCFLESQDLHQPHNAGIFVNNRQMELYGSFGVPLIHGWIPSSGNVLHSSLSRVAPNYDDFQAHLVRKTELREKLDTDRLLPEEATLLEDLYIVEDFLSTTASQLTQDGIRAIQESLTPGATAILFRNNHFSTLHKDPRTNQVYSLITDEGYAEHDEVVWEGFVDVRGQGNGLFSGDFRSISHNAPDVAMPHDAHQDQSLGAVPNTDEDANFAAALQLQEEEEALNWHVRMSRREQEEASRRYLDNFDPQPRRTYPRGGGSFHRSAAAGRGISGPQVPPRGGSQSHVPRDIAARPLAHRPAAGPRAPVAPRRRSSSEEAPPPTYDEAAKGPAYHPPTDGASSPRPHPPPRPRQTSSAWAETMAMQRPMAPKEAKKEKDCVIM